MFCTRLSFLPILCVFLPGLGLATVPEVELEPAPTWKSHEERIREGIRLHDQQDFDGAIEIYRKVLSENGDDVLALYELAFSLSAKEDHKGCRDTAYQGARYNSDHLPTFRMMLANCLDALGEIDEAIDAYAAAIHEAPEHYMLRFNLAVTLVRAGRLDDARNQLRAALTLNPSHPGSHMLLSEVWAGQGYRIPALLASLRFLSLEPNSGRSPKILERARGLLETQVQQKNGETIINIFMGEAKDEGDFGPAEVMMSLAAAVETTPEYKKRKKKQKSRESVASRAVDRLRSVIEASRNANPEPKAQEFAARFYLPYFGAVRDSGNLETLVYLAFYSTGDEEVVDWVENNPDCVQDFLAWSEAYAGWRGVAITNDAP